jgi:AraC-like DNA-binding protein
MSPATLRRKLEQCHGERYADMVDALKREVAAQQLASGSLRIEDVGRHAGFAKNAAFYRAFRRWYGCTPAEYRRALGTR